MTFKRAVNKGRYLLAFLRGACVVACFLVFSQYVLVPPSALVHDKARDALGDGCCHVYLDVGSNIGIHPRFLFEPNKYPLATDAQRVFSENFGDPSVRRNDNICTFSFEPNPSFKKRHDDLKNMYASKGWTYVPIQAGVADVDGSMVFYHQDDAARGELGFSSSPRPGRNVEAETVPVIRLASWLKNNIRNRKIPLSDNPVGDPCRVVMKLDIENMEYITLPDLLFSGVLCESVNHVFMEFHSAVKFPPILEPPNNTTGKGGLSLTQKEKISYESSLLKAFHSQRSSDCITEKIELLDDESYWDDGQPLG